MAGVWQEPPTSDPACPSVSKWAGNFQPMDQESSKTGPLVMVMLFLSIPPNHSVCYDCVSFFFQVLPVYLYLFEDRQKALDP